MADLKQDLETLVCLYREESTKLSEREKAGLEEDIWTLVKRSDEPVVRGAPNVRREWLTGKLGGRAGDYDHRFFLVRVNSAADELWDRIERQALKLSAAAIVLRKAKANTRVSGRTLKEEVGIVLRGQSVAAVASEVVKKDSPRKKLVRKQSDKTDAKKPIEKPDLSHGSRKIQQKDFLARVEALCMEFARDQLDGEADEFLTVEIVSEFVWWARVACDSMKQSIKQLRDDTKRDRLDKVGRARFAIACEVLGVRGAVFGKEIDLDKAKKRMFLRAASLHPDRHGGVVSDAMKDEYNAVNGSYAVLVHYMEQIRENSK